MLHDVTVRPTVEPPGVGIARDPHARLLQARLHHIGRHRGLHHKAGAQAMLQMTGFGTDDATQRHAEDAGALHIQMPGQDAGGIGLIQAGKLVQREDSILCEVRDDAVLQCLAVQRWRVCDWADALLEQSIQLIFRQSTDLASIWKDHFGGGIRLIDGCDDVASRLPLLQLHFQFPITQSVKPISSQCRGTPKDVRPLL
jgi:hypothetical protein